MGGSEGHGKSIGSDQGLGNTGATGKISSSTVGQKVGSDLTAPAPIFSGPIRRAATRLVGRAANE